MSSDPADGSTITTPYTLTATFAEEADPRSSLSVENSAGTVVATGTVDPSDKTKMTVQLPQLPYGTYTVLWTTVTADDNGVERGAYGFNVGSVNQTQPPMYRSPGVDTGASGSGNDVVIAVGIAAVLIVVVAIVVFGGRRR